MASDALAPYVAMSSAAMICKLGRSLSYMMKYFNYLCHVNVEEWKKL